MMIRAFILWLISAGFALAQSGGDLGDDLASNARAASERLNAAARLLETADDARNRVKALTETVHAFEDGLEAMREGLRRAAIREEILTRELHAREAETARLLGVLQSIENTPAPALLLHPSGPVGTARSGMILSEVTPALVSQVAVLQSHLQEITVVRALQQTAADTLQEGLDGALRARTQLSQAISDRTPLPRRFTEDPARTAVLLASTETLQEFASGLSEISTDEATVDLPDISHRKGQLPLPVQGRVLRTFGTADAAGVIRPGIILAARPYALVTTPSAATIRYQGPLLDYGNVVILEPQSDLLLVLAGLDAVYGTIGEVLPGGTPVGLMGGPDTDSGAILIPEDKVTGAEQSETLYIEVRQKNIPVDPAIWFRTDRASKKD